MKKCRKHTRGVAPKSRMEFRKGRLVMFEIVSIVVKQHYLNIDMNLWYGMP